MNYLIVIYSVLLFSCNPSKVENKSPTVLTKMLKQLVNLLIPSQNIKQNQFYQKKLNQ